MNPSYDFTRQVAFVTGAGSGMGLATARAFAQSGAAVVLADLDPTTVGAASDELTAAATGPSASMRRADEDSVTAAVGPRSTSTAGGHGVQQRRHPDPAV